MVRAKLEISRITRSQLITFVEEPAAKTLSLVLDARFARFSSSISTNPPGRNIAMNTPDDLIGTLSRTLAMPCPASCGMSKIAIAMRMYGKRPSQLSTLGAERLGGSDQPWGHGLGGHMRFGGRLR